MFVGGVSAFMGADRPRPLMSVGETCTAGPLCGSAQAKAGVQERVKHALQGVGTTIEIPSPFPVFKEHRDS